jgi:hypothetical protein
VFGEEGRRQEGLDSSTKRKGDHQQSEMKYSNSPTMKRILCAAGVLLPGPMICLINNEFCHVVSQLNLKPRRDRKRKREDIMCNSLAPSYPRHVPAPFAAPLI